PSGIYRFDAAMQWLQSTGTAIADVHRHSHAMQERFLAGLERLRLRELPLEALVPTRGQPRGNFLTFDLANAQAVHEAITARDVTVDRRDRRLRFGFGIYHDAAQVDALLDIVGRALGD